MRDESREPNEALDNLIAWIAKAKPGERYLYHEGQLARDKRANKQLAILARFVQDNIRRHHDWVANTALASGLLIARANPTGKITACQKRIGDQPPATRPDLGRFAYEVVRLAS